MITGVSIPLSFLIPWLVARTHDQRLVMCVVMGCYPLGYLGLMVAPHGGAVAWAVLVGIGTATFPMILTLIGLRARTPAGTAALSGFAQSTGYLIAGTGPFGIGLLHDVSGGWTVPLVALLIVTVPQFLLGLAGLAPGVRRGRARRAPSGRSLRPERYTTDSGSSCWPVGPIWMSVPISGHTPQS